MSKTNEASKPESIFLMKECVKTFGVLKAAIIADVMFWIIQDKEPWIKAQKHADWFHVNEKTIRSNSKGLAKHGCFGRRISHLKNGKQGACKYFPVKQPNYRTIYNFYYAMFNNNNPNSDLGKFTGGDSEVREVANFVTFPLLYIEEIGDVTTAYILTKLYWITFSKDPSLIIRYRSKTRFGHAMHLDRNTAMRHLKWLSENGYVDYIDYDSGIKITVQENNFLYSIMQNLIEVSQQKRNDGIMDKFN